MGSAERRDDKEGAGMMTPDQIADAEMLGDYIDQRVAEKLKEIVKNEAVFCSCGNVLCAEYDAISEEIVVSVCDRCTHSAAIQFLNELTVKMKERYEVRK